jgi:Protein of unknown function (DUF3024)
MNAHATQASFDDHSVYRTNEFDRKRIERALDKRVRYKYVHPTVTAINGAYLIKSPCCSRNIDPDGGIIDIAMLQYAVGSTPWQLYRIVHANQQWRFHSAYTQLSALLEHLNADPQRLFWQ